MPVPTVDASGTQTAIIGTEHTLRTTTGGGHFELHVDTAAMAQGDNLELRVKSNILAAGSVRVARIVERRDAQNADEGYVVVVVLGNDQVCVFTLKQTLGTGRAFPWKVLSF